MVVDAPGSTPAAQLQRAALALDGGEVLIGYGGNYGDYGSYHGWLIGAPETGGSRRSSEAEQQSPLLSFEVEKNSHGGAIWGAGNGPAIDSSGSVWAASGNGFGSTYQYQESVLKLDSSLNVLDHWAPSNWSQLDISDADLGSSEPLLLPGGLVCQIGKGGVGYLLSASDLGGTGASPRFQAQVCDQTGHASYGGGVYYAGVLYVACSDGLRALSLDTSTPSLTPLPGWQVTSAAIGPPLIPAGWCGPQAGTQARYTGLTPKPATPRSLSPLPLWSTSPAPPLPTASGSSPPDKPSTPTQSPTRRPPIRAVKSPRIQPLPKSHTYLTSARTLPGHGLACSLMGEMTRPERFAVAGTPGCTRRTSRAGQFSWP